jgi:hypothetical protein
MEWSPSQSMFLHVCQNFFVGLPASVKKQHETGGSHWSDYECYCTLWCFFFFNPTTLYGFLISSPHHVRAICQSPPLFNFQNQYSSISLISSCNTLPYISEDYCQSKHCHITWDQSVQRKILLLTPLLSSVILNTCEKLPCYLVKVVQYKRCLYSKEETEIVEKWLTLLINEAVRVDRLFSTE